LQIDLVEECLLGAGDESLLIIPVLTSILP